MAEKRTKIGKFRTVYRGPIYEVQQAKARYSDGRTAVFEQIIRPHGAAVIPIDARGRILLAREYRPRFKRYLWVFPGGRGERGEKPQSIAARELQEEVGLKPKRIKLFHVFRFGNVLAWNDYYFLGCHLTASKISNSEDEDMTLVPKTIPQLFTMLKSGAIENPHVAYVIIKLYRLRIPVLRWAMSEGRGRARFI